MPVKVYGGPLDCLIFHGLRRTQRCK